MHWQYLQYVLRHKWFVFQAGLRLGVPLWQLIVHDLSKFLPSEWMPYARKFYGGPWPKQHYGDWKNVFSDEYTQEWIDLEFDEAWNYHQKRNPHHWQFWVLREDSGATKALRIPRRYMLEMLADWAGAGQAITGKVDVANWYARNADHILLHPMTQVELEILIEQHYGLPKENPE